MKILPDDRRIALCDIFPNLTETSEIDVSIIYPHTFIGWHRHFFQIDQQIVIKGSLKIGLCNAPNQDIDNSLVAENQDVLNIENQRYKLLEDWQEIRKKIIYECGADKVNYLYEWPTEKGVVKWNYLSEYNIQNYPLDIQRGIWHSSYNYTDEPAILLYHISKKFNINDEHRCNYKIMGWNYEKEIR